MKYGLDQLERDISDIITETSTIRHDRSKRYGRPNDTLFNVRTAGGFRACMCEAIQCLCAIQKQCFVPFERVDNKSMENLSADLINYALYLLILYRQELNQTVGIEDKPCTVVDLTEHFTTSSGHIPPLKSNNSASDKSLPLSQYMKVMPDGRVVGGDV